jgi:uncharacterized protein YjiK
LKFTITIISLVLVSFTSTTYLKSIKKYKLKIEEPSDISLSTDGKSFYIVSDKGSLYKTDLEGKTITKSNLVGTDFEAVFAKDNKVYVVDERYRKIYTLNENTLTQESAKTIPYSGARNSAYEGICWNKAKKRFVLAIEKSPVMLYELDENLNVVNEIDFKSITDISSITYADGFLWILSEEDHCLVKADANTYQPIKKYNINIVGAEGVVFDNNKQLYITSDGMGLIYKYNTINE